MPVRCTLGVDIGTSSSKGVLVDQQGTVVATRVVEHEVDRPRPGWVEMDARIWWDEFIELSQGLMADAHDSRGDVEVAAVGVSGMGPCVLLTDDGGRAGPSCHPLRRRHPGHAPGRADDGTARGRRGHPGRRVSTDLPGRRTQDRLGGGGGAGRVRACLPASTCQRRGWSATSPAPTCSTTSPPARCPPSTRSTPSNWHDQWWERFAPRIERPALAWAGEVVGAVTTEAARVTGIRAGTPVVCGTIDAWAEAVSVGAHEVGDLMLMYGSTMFLIATGKEALRTPSMWTTVGAFPGTRNLAGGLATSGALTAWLKDLTRADYPTLLRRGRRLRCRGPRSGHASLLRRGTDSDPRPRRAWGGRRAHPEPRPR